MTHKPEGYTSVAPYLIVTNAQATIDFAHAVFDAEPLRIFHTDDGGIMHAEIRIEDTVVMMGEMAGGTPAHVHVYVMDVDIAFDRALAAGAEIVQQIMDKGDGDRRCGVTDSNGTTWWLSTQKEMEPDDAA